MDSVISTENAKEIRVLILDGKAEVFDAKVVERIDKFLDRLNETDAVKNLETGVGKSIAEVI
jgi:hypothetical protein